MLGSFNNNNNNNNNNNLIYKVLTPWLGTGLAVCGPKHLIKQVSH